MDANHTANPYESSQVQTAKVITPATELSILKWNAKSYLWKFAALLAVANAFIIYACWDTGGWGVMGFIFMIGPSMNAILGLASIVRLMFLYYKYPEVSFALPFLASLALPVLAVIGDWYIVAEFVPTRGGC